PGGEVTSRSGGGGTSRLDRLQSLQLFGPEVGVDVVTGHPLDARDRQPAPAAEQAALEDQRPQSSTFVALDLAHPADLLVSGPDGAALGDLVHKLRLPELGVDRWNVR